MLNQLLQFIFIVILRYKLCHNLFYNISIFNVSLSAEIYNFWV